MTAEAREAGRYACGACVVQRHAVRWVWLSSEGWTHDPMRCGDCAKQAHDALCSFGDGIAVAIECAQTAIEAGWTPPEDWV